VCIIFEAVIVIVILSYVALPLCQKRRKPVNVDNRIRIADAVFSAVTELLVVCAAATWAITGVAESYLSGQRSVRGKRFITSVDAAWRSTGTTAWSYLQRVDRPTVCWGHQRKQFQESCHSESARCLVIVLYICCCASDQIDRLPVR